VHLHKTEKGVGADVSNSLWFGILIGILVGTFAPGGVKIVVFIIMILLSDVVHGTSHDFHNIHFVVPPWLIGLAGLIFGLWAFHFARRRGLQHLGQAELQNRWTSARGISKWGW